MRDELYDKIFDRIKDTYEDRILTKLYGITPPPRVTSSFIMKSILPCIPNKATSKTTVCQ